MLLKKCHLILIGIEGKNKLIEFILDNLINFRLNYFQNLILNIFAS